MRVSIKHRQEGQQHIVDCNVEFSDDERKIIETRALRDYVVTQTGRTSSAVTAVAAPMAFGCAGGAVRIVAGIATFVGIPIGIVGSSGGGGPGWIIFWLGVALFIGSFFIAGSGEAIADNAAFKAGNVTVGQILDQKHFWLGADTPGEAKSLDLHIREQLGNLKSLISSNAEVGQSDTFEL